MADEFTKAALYGIKTFNKKVKEKIGMEKLIGLAIKYDREKEGASFDWNITNGEFENHIYQKYLISKEYGFIKWLVENDKIDLGEKLFNLTKNDNRKSTICDLDNNDFSWEDTFLMLLAISDTPIEDLISYLK